MDANNIAWVVSHHQDGYPPGGFFQCVLDMIFSPPPDARYRLWRLVEIFNLADETRTRDLESALGVPDAKALPVLFQLYQGNGGVDEAHALDALAATLQILPQLLTRMPEVAAALDEYRLRDRVRRGSGSRQTGRSTPDAVKTDSGSTLWEHPAQNARPSTRPLGGLTPSGPRPPRCPRFSRSETGGAGAKGSHRNA